LEAGGLMLRMTANEYPEAVKGLLFADPFTNEIVELPGAGTIDI
jgi:hypothetical protein